MAVVNKHQNNFTTGVLTPAAYARVDIAKYAAGCKRIINGIVHAHGGISNRPGTYYVDTLPGRGLLIPFTYSVEQTYALCFYDNGGNTVKMRVYKNAAGPVADVATPFAPQELPDLKFVQSADTMFFVHPAHKPLTLTRHSHTEWVFAELKFVPSVPTPVNVKATPTGFVDETNTYIETEAFYKVAAVNEREEESMPSAEVEAKVLSTWVSGAKVTLTWDKVAGAVRYEVYKNTRGYYAWAGSAESNKFIDDNIEGDNAVGPKENRDPFAKAGDYPGAIGIYQQRLVFGRSDNEPQTVWLTETGSFDSMAVSYPLRDDNAITVTVDSKQMNEIRHFVVMRDVVMMTSGAEFHMSAGRNSDAITPTSIHFSPQSYWGCSNVPPIVIGDHIVFSENSGKSVRDFKYEYTADAYRGEDVSILAEHLLDSPIVDWAYQQNPWKTVWVCLENGRLLTFTYMKEQEIFAWSEHESANCKFLSVTSIREDREDNVYFVTERRGKYFVEFQERRHYGDAIEDSFFVDCGLKYKGDPITKITEGLAHLAGEKVTVLADGSVVRDLKVEADGSLTLPFPAGSISVGLGYRTLIETLDPEVKTQSGTTSGERKNVVGAALHLRESRGLKIGPVENRMTEVKFDPPAKWGAPPPLKSGVLNITLPGDHRDAASVVFVQDDPLPLTVLSITTKVNVG